MGHYRGPFKIPFGVFERTRENDASTPSTKKNIETTDPWSALRDIMAFH